METHRVGRSWESLISNQTGGFQGAEQPQQKLQQVAFGQRVRAELGFILDPQDCLTAGDPAGGKVESTSLVPLHQRQEAGLREKEEQAQSPRLDWTNMSKDQEQGQCGCSTVGSEWSHLMMERIEGQGTLRRVGAGLGFDFKHHGRP